MVYLDDCGFTIAPRDFWNLWHISVCVYNIQHLSMYVYMYLYIALIYMFVHMCSGVQYMEFIFIPFLA